NREIRVHGRVPFERGGLPGIWRGRTASEERVDKVGKEEKLGGGEEDRRPGNEAVERQGSGEEMTCSIRDAGELGVVAASAHQAGEVHGQKSGVGSEQRSPEVKAAEGFGHE